MTEEYTDNLAAMLPDKQSAHLTTAYYAYKTGALAAMREFGEWCENQRVKFPVPSGSQELISFAVQMGKQFRTEMQKEQGDE